MIIGTLSVRRVNGRFRTPATENSSHDGHAGQPATGPDSLLARPLEGLLLQVDQGLGQIDAQPLPFLLDEPRLGGRGPGGGRLAADPLQQLVPVEPPLAPDLTAGKLPRLDHALNRAQRNLQQVGGLLHRQDLLGFGHHHPPF